MAVKDEHDGCGVAPSTARHVEEGFPDRTVNGPSPGRQGIGRPRERYDQEAHAEEEEWKSDEDRGSRR